MTQKIELFPGITLSCFPADRFKQACISVQLVRPMCREEVSKNALLPAVLLRGSRLHSDLRSITQYLDDLYGADISAMVRRVGDYQTTGFGCGYIEDRFTLGGESVLAPLTDFIRELLLDPLTENGVFCADFVDGEKQNLISAIESTKNDKRAYAVNRLLRILCKDDSFGIPRLGDREQVEEITPATLYAHYEKILRESRIDCFYVGSADPKDVASLLKPVFAGIARDYHPLPPQKALASGAGEDVTERMDVAQGKLCMGFTTPITLRTPEFAVMQVCNTVLGAGMTSKLFMNIREKMSLCYDIGSSYQGSKGIVVVTAGIDCDKDKLVREKVLEELEHCRNGEITPEELKGAKQALISGLGAVHDSAGAIENYYATSALSGLALTPEEYKQAVEQVTAEQVAAVARTLKADTVYFLKGVQA